MRSNSWTVGICVLQAVKTSTPAAVRSNLRALVSNGRPSNGGKSLATLYDISGDYKWKHGFSFGLYFGYAVGGDVIKKIYPANSNGALGYSELNYRF